MIRFIVIYLMLATCLTTYGQQGKSTSAIFNPRSGYINMTELIPAIGLGQRDYQFAKYIVGLTTVNGYQIAFKENLQNQKLLIGGGTGVLAFNEGAAIPLYLDIRFIWMATRVTPYIYADGGYLLALKDFSANSRPFINGGAGARYTYSNSIAFHAGLGLWMQSGGDHPHDAFLNLQLGISIRPN